MDVGPVLEQRSRAPLASASTDAGQSVLRFPIAAATLATTCPSDSTLSFIANVSPGATVYRFGARQTSEKAVLAITFCE